MNQTWILINHKSNTLSNATIVYMLEIVIDNLFVMFSTRLL